MSTRYFTNLAIALAGGFLVVASRVFATNTVEWLSFAVAIGVVVISLAAQLDRSRGLIQRGLDGLLLSLGVVTIVFSQTFSGTTLTWLAFAEALGFVGLAVTGLTVHEVETWRAAHQLPAFYNLEARRSESAVASRAAA